MGAFEKMLSAPEIADKNFEVTLYALGHNGWDESTHMVSFYFKAHSAIWRRAKPLRRHLRFKSS